MVGVAALWGYYINSGVGNDNISATCNSATATNNYRRTEPFRGIGTRACTIRKTIIKCFLLPPHPSLRDTFSQRAKALTAVQLFIRKTSIWYPFGGLPRHKSVPRNDIFTLKTLQGYVPCHFAFYNQQRALDHEGRAVGVAALWGYYINSGVGNGYISATCNSATATNNYRRTEPFRGIGTRACTIRKTIIKCFLLPPPPSLRDTFSQRAKA